MDTAGRNVERVITSVSRYSVMMETMSTVTDAQRHVVSNQAGFVQAGAKIHVINVKR